MISCTQKTLVLLVGFALAFSFSADAAQVRQQLQSQTSQGDDKQDLQDPTKMLNKGHESHDDEEADGDEADGKDDDDDDDAAKQPVYQVKSPTKTATKNDEDEEKEEDADSDDHSSDGSNAEADLKTVEKQLSVNLRKQAAFKHSMERLTDKEESDEEIDEAAKEVANETQSVALGGMLGHMWKDMRTLELPAYAKHVKEELHELKHDESELEAKLTAAQGKLSGEKDKKEKEEKDEKDEKDETDEKDEKEDDEEEHDDHEKKLKADSKAGASTWNFYTQGQLHGKLFGSLVYVVGGILAAVLFKQFRSKHFALEPKGDSFPSTRDFSHHIFGFLDDKKLCCLAFCCPCLAWANTLDQRKGLLSYWRAFLVFFAALVLYAYTMGLSFIFLIVVGVYYRQKLREQYEIDSCYSGKKNTLIMDILLWSFCQPCAIIQEAREEGVIRQGVNPWQSHECATASGP